MKETNNNKERTARFKALNRGYTLGLFCPAGECIKALREKLTSLSKDLPEKYEAILKGFELAILERNQQRVKDLKKRRSNSKNLDRGR